VEGSRRSGREWESGRERREEGVGEWREWEGWEGDNYHIIR
jgi:hypothetical protein